MKSKAHRQALKLSFINSDFGVTETTIMDMCDEVLGVGAALKARIATDRDTGELLWIQQTSTTSIYDSSTSNLTYGRISTSMTCYLTNIPVNAAP